MNMNANDSLFARRPRKPIAVTDAERGALKQFFDALKDLRAFGWEPLNEAPRDGRAFAAVGPPAPAMDGDAVDGDALDGFAIRKFHFHRFENPGFRSGEYREQGRRVRAKALLCREIPGERAPKREDWGSVYADGSVSTAEQRAATQ